MSRLFILLIYFACKGCVSFFCTVSIDLCPLLFMQIQYYNHAPAALSQGPSVRYMYSATQPHQQQGQGQIEVQGQPMGGASYPQNYGGYSVMGFPQMRVQSIETYQPPAAPMPQQQQQQPQQQHPQPMYSSFGPEASTYSVAFPPSNCTNPPCSSVPTFYTSVPNGATTATPQPPPQYPQQLYPPRSTSPPSHMLCPSSNAAQQPQPYTPPSQMTSYGSQRPQMLSMVQPIQVRLPMRTTPPPSGLKVLGQMEQRLPPTPEAVMGRGIQMMPGVHPNPPAGSYRAPNPGQPHVNSSFLHC